MQRRICCPHCSYVRNLPADRLPAPHVRAQCPRCGGAFTVAEGLAAQPAVPAEPVTIVEPERQLPVTAASGAADGSPPTAAAQSPRFAPPPERERTLPFVFTGNAREFFGIWIVNTLLRIVTLGIYSPWAKVRTRRYFYANTLLDSAPFDYLADPLAILKGWAIAIGFFFAYSFISSINPIIQAFSGLIFLAVLPWVIVRSRMFNCRNSAHRNIRFSFQPNYREAYIVFAGLAILTFLTFGLLAPYMIYRQKKFLVENTLYGTSPFTFESTPKKFYAIYLKAIGIILCLFAGGGFFMALISGGVRSLGARMSGAPDPMAVVVFFTFFTVYLGVIVYVYTAQTNLVLNSTSLGGSTFRSDLRFGRMLGLMISSAVAIPLSLGLLIPWVLVRFARYRLEALSLVGRGDLARFAAGTADEVTATGEELGDVFGIDFGF